MPEELPWKNWIPSVRVFPFCQSCPDEVCCQDPFDLFAVKMQGSDMMKVTTLSERENSPFGKKDCCEGGSRRAIIDNPCLATLGWELERRLSTASRSRWKKWFLPFPALALCLPMNSVASISVFTYLMEMLDNADYCVWLHFSDLPSYAEREIKPSVFLHPFFAFADSGNWTRATCTTSEDTIH